MDFCVCVRACVRVCGSFVCHRCRTHATTVQVCHQAYYQNTSRSANLLLSILHSLFGHTYTPVILYEVATTTKQEGGRGEKTRERKKREQLRRDYVWDPPPHPWDPHPHPYLPPCRQTGKVK